MANMPFFSSIYRAKRAGSATASRGAMISSDFGLGTPSQQPRQISLSRTLWDCPTANKIVLCFRFNRTLAHELSLPAELGSIRSVRADGLWDRHTFEREYYDARTDHSGGRHSVGIVGSRRHGTNWRRERHQRWCCSKVRIRCNRADGRHRPKGRDGEGYDERQKEKEGEEDVAGRRCSSKTQPAGSLRRVFPWLHKFWIKPDVGAAPPVHMIGLTETREITLIFGCIRT